jgi:hypothetical protein
MKKLEAVGQLGSQAALQSGSWQLAVGQLAVGSWQSAVGSRAVGQSGSWAVGQSGSRQLDSLTSEAYGLGVSVSLKEVIHHSIINPEGVKYE